MLTYRFVVKPTGADADSTAPPPPADQLRHVARKWGLPPPEKWIKAPSAEAAALFRDFYGLRDVFLPPWPLGGASGELDFDDGVHAVVDVLGRLVETGNCRPEHWQDDWKAEMEAFREKARTMPHVFNAGPFHAAEQQAVVGSAMTEIFNEVAERFAEVDRLCNRALADPDCEARERWLAEAILKALPGEEPDFPPAA